MSVFFGRENLQNYCLLKEQYVNRPKNVVAQIIT